MDDTELVALTDLLDDLQLPEAVACIQEMSAEIQELNKAWVGHGNAYENEIQHLKDEIETRRQELTDWQEKYTEMTASRDHWQGRAGELQRKLDYWIDRYNHDNA